LNVDYLNKDDQIKCRGCGAEAGEQQQKCVVCGKNLHAEQIERCRSIKPVRERFDINSFLKENLHLFTLVGIFGALSFYLTNLIPKNTENTLNLSGTCAFFFNESVNESQNSSIIINKLVNGSFLGTGGFHPSEAVNASNSFFLMDPAYGLQIGVVTCYFFFFIFTFSLLYKLLDYEGSPLAWIISSPLLLLITVTVIYLANTYMLIISAMVIVSIAIITMAVDRWLCVRIYFKCITPREKLNLLFLLFFGNLSLIPVLVFLLLFVKESSYYPIFLGLASALILGLASGSLQIMTVIIDKEGIISRILKPLQGR